MRTIDYLFPGQTAAPPYTVTIPDSLTVGVLESFFVWLNVQGASATPRAVSVTFRDPDGFPIFAVGGLTDAVQFDDVLISVGVGLDTHLVDGAGATVVTFGGCAVDLHPGCTIAVNWTDGAATDVIQGARMVTRG